MQWNALGAINTFLPRLEELVLAQTPRYWLSRVPAWPCAKSNKKKARYVRRIVHTLVGPLLASTAPLGRQWCLFVVQAVIYVPVFILGTYRSSRPPAT